MAPSVGRLGGGDGEDAGAGAEIDDLARPAALQEIIEGEQTAARARVMRGAEGSTRVDLDGEEPARHTVPVMAAMDEETPRLDLAALALRQPHPIKGRDRFDPERPKPVSRSRLGDQLEQSFARRRRVVMGEHLESVFPALEQSDRNGRWIEGLFERLGNTHRRRSRGLDAGLMGHGRRGPGHDWLAQSSVGKSLHGAKLRPPRRADANRSC